MDETQTLAVLALRELLDNPDHHQHPVRVRTATIGTNSSVQFARPDGVKARLVRPWCKQVPVRIFARPDRGSAQSARSRLMDVVNVDRTAAVASTADAIAEIATLRQKLAAAEVRIRENTDRGQKPIKGGAGQRIVDGKNFRLADEVRYIQRWGTRTIPHRRKRDHLHD
jgi:hypothetical protein